METPPAEGGVTVYSMSRRMHVENIVNDDITHVICELGGPFTEEFFKAWTESEYSEMTGEPDNQPDGD